MLRPLPHPAVVACSLWRRDLRTAAPKDIAMNWILPSAAGMPNFFLYGAVGATLVFIFSVLYVRFTGHDELKLIREGNASAALAFGGSLVGFALPVSKAIAQASSIPDCVLWGFAGLVVQLLAYLITRLLVKDLSRKIEDNVIATAIVLASISLVAGQLNAAAMTYYPTVGGIVEAL
jgi:putative membrane protein